MNRLYTSGDYSSSCSSDTDNGSSSDDEETENITRKRASVEQHDAGLCLKKSAPQNIIFKLQNREVSQIIHFMFHIDFQGQYLTKKLLFFQKSGYFTNNIAHKDKKLAFVRVPRRLNFCLKEIVPYCYLTG